MVIIQAFALHHCNVADKHETIKTYTAHSLHHIRSCEPFIALQVGLMIMLRRQQLVCSITTPSEMDFF